MANLVVTAAATKVVTRAPKVIKEVQVLVKKVDSKEERRGALGKKAAR